MTRNAIITGRPAERRDLPALAALAAEQARTRLALDPRLSSGSLVSPFLSDEQTLGAVYGAWDHATYVALRGDVIVGGINIHKVEQKDRDPFATYYPRRFTSVGLLVAPDAGTLRALLVRAREQAARWKTPALLVHNASADQVLRELLFAAGFRTYYHYALRTPPEIPTADGGPQTTDDDSQFASASHEPPSAVRRLPSHDQPPSTAVPHLRLERGAGHPDGVVRPPSFVRRASRADLDALVRLGMESVTFHASIERTMQVPRDERKKMRKRYEAILDAPQESTMLVAEQGRQVVGFYSIYIQSIDETWTPPLFAPGRYGLIAEVSVEQAMRRRGVGHQLFTAAEQWFRERGARQIWLIYLPANPLSSRFWQSLSFVPVWEVLLKDEG